VETTRTAFAVKKGLFRSLGLLLLTSCTVRLQPLAKDAQPVHTEQYAQEISRLTGRAWLTGNTVRTLPNGGRYIPAMLQAIRSAQKSILWENFVAVDCQSVADISQALSERARAGVQVQVILDAYGCSTYGDAHIETMKAAGIQLRKYSDWKLYNPFAYNHRTHRRILVVDDRVGFIGGAGLAYAWEGHAEDASRWRDTMYEVRGPLLQQLREDFQDNAEEMGLKALAAPATPPGVTSGADMEAISVLGAPLEQRERIGSTFRHSLRAAQSSILICHAYFIPPEPILHELLAARARGVRVELLVPGETSDMPLCRATSLPALRQLMRAGVILHEFQPCMMHGKLVIVDAEVSIIGSGNLDSRSFFINDENNLIVRSRAFAAEQLAMFQADCARSRVLKETDLTLPRGRRIKGWLGRRVRYLL
jgi:cardiolipin synthase A/B